MLLEDLHKLVKLGAERPLILWINEFKKLGSELIPMLEKVQGGLEQDTEAKGRVESLINELQKDKPSELELARSLSYIAELFRDQVGEEHRDMIAQYIQDCSKFQTIGQASEFFQDKRQSLKSTLSAEKQLEHDKRLFANEGMMYCLEYYLAMYKAIQDATSAEDKQRYIESPEVDLGFGPVPGLRIDFERDEVLSKFIYSILDDQIRERLVAAYYSAKLSISEMSDPDLIHKEFKKLVQVLLDTFQEVGIEHLASFFFTPYGDKPLIKDIKL